MRIYKMELGDNTLVLATTFKSIQLITDRVMDPMLIARDQVMQEQAAQAGRPYEPQFKMTVGNVVKMLHAAHEAAGGSLSFDEIGDMVMDFGPANVIEPLGEFLVALVAGETKEVNGGSKGKKKKSAMGNA